MILPQTRPHLILDTHIIRPSNRIHRVRPPLLQLVTREDTLLTLLALDLGDCDVILARRRPLAAVDRGGVEVAVALFVPAAVAAAV